MRARRPALGLVYWPVLEPLLESQQGLVEHLEVEPQPFWHERPGVEGAYDLDEAAFERMARIPLPKSVHGVGFPVGGTLGPSVAALRTLAASVHRLSARWTSEHLAFNAFRGTGGSTNTLFLLPPFQGPHAVALAASSLARMRDATGTPVAFETGVNYLRPQRGEWGDGRFWAEVAEAADCGILLDLHNVWTNERNGRGHVEAALADLPPERVVEIHVAGGVEQDGAWLDGHCDLTPGPVLDLLAAWLPRFPNVRAVVFEILPPFVRKIGLEPIAAHLRKLKALLEAVRPQPPACASRRRAADAGAHDPRPEHWEEALGSLVLGRSPEGDLARGLREDPGIDLMRRESERFRAGMATEGLRYSLRALRLLRGEADVRRLLEGFWSVHAPARFTSSEALALAAHLLERIDGPPPLTAMLRLERASLRVAAGGEGERIELDQPPLDLLAALAQARLPPPAPPQRVTVDVRRPAADEEPNGVFATHWAVQAKSRPAV